MKFRLKEATKVLRILYVSRDPPCCRVCMGFAYVATCFFLPWTFKFVE
jgi:hypothetical protein